MAEPTVCVVGSLNHDTLFSVASLPAPGETVLSLGRRTSPGGKGANQAAAAAARGVAVVMVGAVGEDEPGRLSGKALEDAGADVSGVRRRADVGTGAAVVVVDPTGENSIVVDPAANATLTPEEVSQSLDALRPGLVLAQLEVPLDAVAAALRTRDSTTVLNPAPIPSDPAPVRDLLPHVDVLVPNRGELGRLVGRPEPVDLDEVRDCVDALDFAGAVVVTLGADGAWCRERGREPVHVAGVPAGTVDATGAGDVFCGALVAGLAEGLPMVDAVRDANAAAARSTTWHGARPPRS